MAFERTPSTQMHPPYLWQEPKQNYSELLHQFFDYTTLQHSRRHLKELTEGAFADSYQLITPPGNLLYFYERLLILLYALRGLWKESSHLKASAFQDEEGDGTLPEHLQELPWQDLPHHLNLEEVRRPFIVLEAFFQLQSLDAWTLELHDWLEAALSQGTITEWLPSERLLTVCTHLNKIVEAAFVLHSQAEHEETNQNYVGEEEQEKNETEHQTALKDAPEGTGDQKTETYQTASTPSLSFSEQFTAIQQELVKRITDAVTVQKIFLLGTTTGDHRTQSIFAPSILTQSELTHCFLVVLVATDGNTNLNQLQYKIENVCQPLIPTRALVFYTESFYDELWERHRFAHAVQTRAVQLYSTVTNKQEEQPLTLNTEGMKKEQESLYAKGMDKAQGFLAGAELYIVRKQYKLAAFMLHQGAEQALHTLLQVTTGLHLTTHNLDRMLCFSTLVSSTVPAIFPRKDENEKRLFALLHQAYTKARYKEDYKVHYPEIQALTSKVKQLITEVTSVCKTAFSA